MTRHRLKSWPRFFAAVDLGSKTVEVRAALDRDFAAGDVLELYEWDPSMALAIGGGGIVPRGSTGRELEVEVLSVSLAVGSLRFDGVDGELSLNLAGRIAFLSIRRLCSH